VIEVLPEENVGVQQCQPEGNRYDAQVVCLGKDVNAQIQDLKIFMVIWPFPFCKIKTLH